MANRLIFKDISGYEGLYKISNTGIVVSCRKIKCRNDEVKEIALKQKIDKDGYCNVNLYNGNSPKMYKVHRLVANAFISNDYNKPTINHINGIKSDNRVENIEWATNKENSEHANKNGLIKRNFGKNNHSSKPVCRKNIDGITIDLWDCAKDAAAFFGRNDGTNITAACKGKLKTAFGYKWSYQ